MKEGHEILKFRLHTISFGYLDKFYAFFLVYFRVNLSVFQVNRNVTINTSVSIFLLS